MKQRDTSKSKSQTSAETKGRLQRLQGQFGHSPASPSAALTSAKVKISKKAVKLQRALDGKIISSSAGEFLCLRQFYPKDFVHGQVNFCNLRKTRYNLSHFTGASDNLVLQTKDFLFFDTETTGLSGAGAVPFLIGFGSFVEGGFETRQYIIPDFADEAAMLEEVFAEFGPEKIIVSYNGKSFDKPLLEDRLIMQRIARALPFAEHVDLLHVSRSLFKRRLGDCSLGNIEKHILSFQRQDDIPGYLVPSVYLDWIHQDETSQLTDVITHNALDIVSLAALMSVISESFESRSQTLASPVDAFSMMQVCARRRQSGYQKLALEIGRDRNSEFEQLGNPEIEFRRAMIFKRAGDLSSAVEIWRRLEAGDNREKDIRRTAQQARLELAKWLEHRCKDYQKALEVTESALRFKLNHPRPIDDWQRRRQRLLRRIGAIKASN